MVSIGAKVKNMAITVVTNYRHKKSEDRVYG
jgi:hypothetical protein